MYGTGFLIILGVFVMALVALSKISKLESRFAQLKIQLGNLADELENCAARSSPAIAAPSH
jgi:hypothetical protein